jgi:MFS family permease
MVGESESNGAVALGVINASKAAGRIISGYLGDKCGRVNTLAAILFFSSLSCLAIWVPASNYVMILVFSVTFGLSTGGVSSLTVSIIPDIFGEYYSVKAAHVLREQPLILPCSDVNIGIDRTATVTGLVFGSAGIPILIGAPVALVLRAAFGYDYIKVYCGIALGGAMLLAVGLRLSLSRRMIARV